MINILIGGDVCPIGRNFSYFRDGNAQSIFNDLLPDFEKADLKMVNLECPLINEKSPLFKCGPVLGVESSAISGLKAAKINVVDLANNHIMDHGPEGLRNTLNVCARNGIATVGAGENLEIARKILIRDVLGIKVGIMGVAEREFSIATHNRPGANLLDIVDYVRNLKSNEGKFDYLIVLVHGGNEHYPFPSPRLKEICHFLVEMGANAVIVQHTHCPGCYEEYMNSFIVYGQGNLIFDLPKREKTFYEGFLVELSIDRELNSKMRIVPYVQSLSQQGTKRMKSKEEHSFLQGIKERCDAVKDDSFLEAQWLEYCRRRKSGYLSRIYGLNYFLVKLIYRNLFARFFLDKASLARLQNTISCESHREVLETLLENNML